MGNISETRMESALGTSTISFLEAVGYKPHEIARMGPGTGLQTDLKLDGDNLLDTLEVLTRKFDVDMSDFNLAKDGHDEGFYLSPMRLLDSRFRRDGRPKGHHTCND